MMNKDEVKADFLKSFSTFENAVNLFDDENFNKVPFADSWTPGQVVQHIILASQDFAHALNAQVEDTERVADENRLQLKSILLNFETKMKSPDFIDPQLKEYDKQSFILKLSVIKQEITKAINDLDLSKTCISFELPGLGHLTRYEAIYFVVYHTVRHAHQLNEIHRFLEAS